MAVHHTSCVSISGVGNNIPAVLIDSKIKAGDSVTSTDILNVVGERAVLQRNIGSDAVLIIAPSYRDWSFGHHFGFLSGSLPRILAVKLTVKLTSLSSKLLLVRLAPAMVLYYGLCCHSKEQKPDEDY
jgi:hypothetical protein